jgi:Rps23 Pro-64 3,4-dihydroxylase Tpa1-like proline 4-hydroxylase
MNYINAAYGGLEDLAKAYRDTYQDAYPFPNINFKNFFNETLLNEVLEDLYFYDKKKVVNFNSLNEKGNTVTGENTFGDKTVNFIHYLNSETFLGFLQNITGINETLIPDPYLEDAGLHETPRGGYLKVHTDYYKHSHTKLDRRICVIVYLNKNWREEYGGHLEFWNQDMTQCEKRILPEFNSCTIYATTDFSFHGSPNPLKCPPDRAKKAFVFYYFTNGRPINEVNDGFNSIKPTFKARRGIFIDIQMKAFFFFKGFFRVLDALLPPVITSIFKKLF